MCIVEEVHYPSLECLFLLSVISLSCSYILVGPQNESMVTDLARYILCATEDNVGDLPDTAAFVVATTRTRGTRNDCLIVER